MKFASILLLFIGLPLLELWALLAVGQHLGPLMTICIVIFTGVLGASLARWEGLRVLSNIQADLSKGQMPAPHLLDGLMIIVAGAVLITPGLITDAFGFLLLMPAFRYQVKQWLRKKLEHRIRGQNVKMTYAEWE